MYHKPFATMKSLYVVDVELQRFVWIQCCHQVDNVGTRELKPL